MNKTMTKLCFLSLMAFGFTACSDDPETSSPADMSSTTDSGMDTVDEGTTEVDMGGEEDSTPDTGDMTDGTDMGGETVVDADCTGANPPERCAADPATFSDWAPASVVSKLSLTATTDTDTDAGVIPGCCYDFTGDGELNNALGNLVKQLGPQLNLSLEDANATLQGAIDDGSVALVLEHQGVDAAGGDFAINFLLGVQDGDFTGPAAEGGNQYKINPSSFDAGVWAQARIPNANLAGTAVTGGPGLVAIAFNLFGISLNLQIFAAQVEAAVASIDDNGVALTGGKLGGVLRLNDLFGALNSFAATNCGCLNLADGDTFIVGDNVADGYECGDLSNSTCEEGGPGEFDGTCASVAGQCTLVATTLPSLADVNSEAIGSECSVGEDCDSLSVGFTFEAAGAVITGVAPAE